MAEILEEGNYKFPDWSIEARCMGALDWGGLKKPKKPCYSKLKLEDGDIVKRCDSDGETYYGFICPKCKQFTELSAEEIPENVKEFALQVASPGSDNWEKLSDEEKELSKEL